MKMSGCVRLGLHQDFQIFVHCFGLGTVASQSLFDLLQRTGQLLDRETRGIRTRISQSDHQQSVLHSETTRYRTSGYFLFVSAATLCFQTCMHVNFLRQEGLGKETNHCDFVLFADC